MFGPDAYGIGHEAFTTRMTDLVVRDAEVSSAWTFVRGGTPAVDEPLYRYPALAYAAQVLAVVGSGVARAALDYAENAGAGYAGVTGAPKLADRPYYRTAVASAEAALPPIRSRRWNAPSRKRSL
jgi:hypothetical protein